MDTSPSNQTQEPRRIDALLSHYALSHQHPTNERIHYVAIPLIMLSLIGLMFSLHPFLAYGFMLASMGYYLRLSLIFTLAMAIWSLLTLGLVQLMGESRPFLCLALFVGAWVLQFIGHRIEGRKPSFFEDIQYLWVGPLFVLRPLCEKWRLAW
jgi:uncharacterized membrane protein YGL010W